MDYYQVTVDNDKSLC